MPLKFVRKIYNKINAYGKPYSQIGIPGSIAASWADMGYSYVCIEMVDVDASELVIRPLKDEVST